MREYFKDRPTVLTKLNILLALFFCRSDKTGIKMKY